MPKQQKFTTKCEENEEGDLLLSFPEELLETMGWGEGTTIDWKVSRGSIVLREIKEDG